MSRSRENLGRSRSRSHLGLKARSLGLLSVSGFKVSFISLGSGAFVDVIGLLNVDESYNRNRRFI